LDPVDVACESAPQPPLSSDVVEDEEDDVMTQLIKLQKIDADNQMCIERTVSAVNGKKRIVASVKPRELMTTSALEKVSSLTDSKQ